MLKYVYVQKYTSGWRIQSFFTKLSMISTNNRDKSFDIVTTELATKCMDKQTMKCLSRVLKCTAIFLSLEKDPFSFNFRTLPFMPLTISADTYRIVYR